MAKIALVCKYIPYYRLGVFNELSLIKEAEYEVVGDINGREGIETISTDILKKTAKDGGITWCSSKSYYYTKSLQLWQTNVVSKIFSKEYDLFILDGAISHLSTWIFSLLCRIAGKKILFWSHGFKGTDRGLKKLIRTVFFKFLPHGLLLYGNFSKGIMVAEGFDPSKIFVIGNSLDYQKQKKIREELLKDQSSLQKLRKSIFKEDHKTLVFIGRLVANKKVDKIIQSLYKLKGEGLNLNCIVIGDGQAKQQLIDLVDKYQLQSQFHFTNALYQEEDIAKFFLISDLMVSPGNVGLNCIHALGYGVPVLTHDNFSEQNPEVEAIVHGKNGFLYKHNDYDDMTIAIKNWFIKGNVDAFYECTKSIESNFNPQKHSQNINSAVLETIK
ncbi:glycosyltransferase [Labilibaculum sp.]|uniref:glycosyltransferase n=1 Tax=Labilibaculum sp. TaxID=2060723 RepID=UPI00356AD068